MKHYWYQRKTIRVLAVTFTLISVLAILGVVFARNNRATTAMADGSYTVWLPVIEGRSRPVVAGTPQPPPASSNSEWSQDAHDAQRTGYIQEEPEEPWTLLWTWNGPDGNGGTGGHFYNAPREARTITGGANVYVPAGSSGLYALAKNDGHQVWHLSNTQFNAVPAYDPATGYLYAGGADGQLYKINASNGTVAQTYAAGSGLNKSVLLVGNYAYVITDSGDLHKVNTSNMTRAWVYSAGSGVSTPAAYSSARGLILFATDDLDVHAIKDADGSALWRVKPTSHPAQAPYTFYGSWPVIAEQHGVVFLRLNLGMSALWSGPNTGSGGGGVYPSSNADTRALLQNNNGDLENLFALNLDDGSQKFVPAVGFGGVEALDGSGNPVLQDGPMPVVKTLDNGKEVAYISFRSGQGSPNDGRWDSHLGEMVLDDNTISGLAAGDLRFVDFPKSYVNITDEQTPLTMAGNTLFQAHWGASESVHILDRQDSKGQVHDDPITGESRPAIIRRMQACSDFNPSTHWTSCGLTLYADGRYWAGPGFWVYWNAYDPPTPDRGAYSEGILPRYSYVSDGLLVVEGNGGDLIVLGLANR